VTPGCATAKRVGISDTRAQRRYRQGCVTNHATATAATDCPWSDGSILWPELSSEATDNTPPHGHETENRKISTSGSSRACSKK
jgi:hypothetical protein